MRVLLQSMPPTLHQATTDPRLHGRLLDTHRQVWDSLLWGHCSFLLGLFTRVHKVLLCPPRVYFPVLCKFWQLYGGVNGDLQQEDLCHKSSMDLWTQWTWVWVNSGSWWLTGRPGVLQFMGLQRVGHDWVTELNWISSRNSLRETPRFSDLSAIQATFSPGKWHTELSIPVFLLGQDPMLCHP